MSRVEPAETRNGLQQDNMEAPSQEGVEITVHHEVFNMKQNTEDGCSFTTEDVNPGQELSAQLVYLQTEDSALKTICAVQKKLEIPSLDESLTQAELKIEETSDPAQEQMQTPSHEESTPAETEPEVTECWDEYLAPTAHEIQGEESSALVFSSLLSNPQTHLTLSREHDTQTGWHFPAGPGLSGEVQCPLFEFPAVSYYPQVEPLPFEGEDRNFFKKVTSV